MVQHVPRIEPKIGADDQGDGQAVKDEADEQLDQTTGHKQTKCLILAIENRASYGILA
ncbi:hypothetical protein ABIB58_002352 [Brevundimonas sp. UYEF29]|uniref:hypothetical protein n=1 Tax=unclassified Brevundimonas TaxID=2622653 RepID=UPI00223545F3|nr:hypothetical protein [Brevundimonas sp. BT-123]MCW0046978.1 hypothetical protein [Brevundimonas sp. BT-123]